MSGDATFLSAAAAKRRQRHIPPALQPFADRIKDRYGVMPLWIETDHIVVTGPARVRRRVDLVFEHTSEFRQFTTGPFTFSTERQQVLQREFTATVGASTANLLFQTPPGKSLANGLFVCFSNFQPAAVEAAHTAVPMSEIDDLAQRVGFGDAYWESSRTWGAPTMFVYTDEQLEHFLADSFRTRLDDAYFELVTTRDEFGVVERRRTFVALDSKQNFDTKYDSNWMYYWR